MDLTTKAQSPQRRLMVSFGFGQRGFLVFFVALW